MPKTKTKTNRRRLATAARKLADSFMRRSAAAAPTAPDAAEGLHRRDLTTRTFALRADTYNDKNRSVEAVLATDNAVRVFDWSTWEVLDEVLLIDGVQLPDSRQVPLLDTHDRSTIEKQLGSTREIRPEGGALVGRRFCDSTAEGVRASIKIKEGHLTDGSIGYRVLEAVMIEPGETASVGGRTYTADPRCRLRIAQKWELKEDSLCPIGADVMAKNRTDAEPDAQQQQRRNNSQRKDTDMNFTDWLNARGWNADTLTDAKRDELKAIYDAQRAAESADATPPAPAAPKAPASTPAAEPVDTDAARAAGRQEEKARRQGVMELARMAGVPDDVRDAALDDDMDLDAARAHFLASVEGDGQRNGSSFSPAPAVHTHDTAIERTHMEAALLMRSGVSGDRIAADYGEPVAERAHSMRRMALADLFRECCRSEGVAFPHAWGFSDEHIRAGMSTVSLPGILSNVANKSLLAAYTAVKDVASLICSVTDHSDFKTATRYRLTDTGEFKLLGPDGELKHGSFGEDSYTNKVTTRGRIVMLTREMIINDDMGAFVQLIQMLGRSAAMALQKAVFTLLLANTGSFFHADNANYGTGATATALAIASLTAAEKKFLDQTDSAGDPISLNPAILLVPTALKVTAENIMDSLQVNETTTANKPKPVNNPHAGKFRPECSPFLSNANLTGYSSAAWYLFSDPADLAALEIAYLNGQRNPIIERGEADFDQLGIGFRGVFDFGVAFQDPRAAVKMTGAD